MDAGLRELLAPVTQELHLARSGRRPVEEVEEEEDRHVGGELADWERLARSQPDGGFGDLVACRQHGGEPTGRGEGGPARRGARRAASARPAGMLWPQARTSPCGWWNHSVSAGRRRRISRRAIRVSGSENGRGPDHWRLPRCPIRSHMAGKLRVRSTPSAFCRVSEA